MTEQQKKQFISLTHFLGEVLGPSYEIVLHAIGTDGSYVAAIANSHISGRTVHSPLTKYAAELVQSGAYKTSDFLCDYKAKVGAGPHRKLIRGSTFFIKNGERLVGILCVNHDNSMLREAVERIIEVGKIDDFSGILGAISSGVQPQETLSMTLDDILDEYLGENNKLLSQKAEGDQAQSDKNLLTVAQKNELFAKLHASGIFKIKGATRSIAKRLGISEPSVYRYLQKVKG